MSAFLDAVKAGDTAAAGRLLDHDPTLLNERDEKGVSPILLALYHGKRDMAQYLIDRGARLSFQDACAMGETDRVKSMLRDDPTLLDRRSPDGYPPLGLAIFFRGRETAKFLIEKGADFNAAADNAQRVAPVHAAAGVCDHEILEMLLERGADPNARQQLDYTPLHTAAARGDIAMAKLLLAHGADPAARGSDGFSVADVGKKYGQTAFVEWWESGREA